MKYSVSDMPSRAGGLSAKDVVTLSRVADEVGLDRFGVTDAPFFQDCVSMMAACLAVTSRIEVVSLVTTPFRRAPDVTAQTWATLAEISGDRAILGVGRGDEGAELWMEPWGLAKRNVVPAIAELVTVCRTMWAGETPEPGPIWKLTGRPLEFGPVGRIPILIGGRGPAILTLAAQVADIVHLAVPFINVGYINDNVALVQAQASAAGREPGSYEIETTVPFSVLDDGAQARALGRRAAAGGLAALAAATRPKGDRGPVVVSPDTPHEFEISADVVNTVVESPTLWTRKPLTPEVEAAIDDRILDAFAIAGTPDEAKDRTAALIAALPGITGLRLKPPPMAPDALPLYRGIIEKAGELAQALG